jgi:hypothetical protein
MSHQQNHDNNRCEQDRGGGPDTDFLDLELSKVMYSEAEAATRAAFRELLEESAKRRLQERWGDRIDALAKLAVDQLIADAEVNLEIEVKIGERNRARRGVEEQLGEILGRPLGAQESGDASDAEPQ